MKFTENSTQKEIEEFLERKYAQCIPDGLEPDFLERIMDANIRHRGRQPDTEMLSLYEAIDGRGHDVTIDQKLEDLLAQNNLMDGEDRFDTARRGYTRYQKRTHEHLNPKRNYGKDDFSLAILAKHFDIAAAIFSVAGKKEKTKIIQKLNEWASAN